MGAARPIYHKNRFSPFHRPPELRVVFRRTRAINRMLKLKKRIKVIPGGTSAGKTFGIIPILIDKATKIPNLEISIVSESIPHLKKGAMKDFLKIMKDTRRFNRKNWHGTDYKYTFSNNSYIEFFSADQSDKVRGPRRDILYLNEGNNLIWDTYHQLSIRTNEEVWLDFNPTNEFWAHEELKDDPDAEWLTLTYKDNEALAPAIVREIEKALPKAFHKYKGLSYLDLFREENIKNSYWANWWKVYGLGETGALEGLVFTNYDFIDSVPEAAEYIGTGIDFGYTNHPTAIIDVYRYNNQYIWDERTYQSDLKNRHIAQLLKSQGRGVQDYITADCAEPKSIDEINEYGFDIVGSEKGSDSINFGISLIQESDFLVTKRSTNIIKELRHYAWDTDKSGKKLNKPIDAFNHAIDAVRYLYMMRIANRNKVDEAAVQEAYEKALQLLG